MMPAYRVKVCWPKAGNSWQDVTAATSLEAARQIWPSKYVYDESQPGARHLTIEVTQKGVVAVEQFVVHSQFQDMEPLPYFDGMVGVAYRVTPIAQNRRGR